METRINKENGDLTAYGFACGYVQKKSVEIHVGKPYNHNGEKGRVEIQLFKDCIYFVQISVYKRVPKHAGCCGVETDEELLTGNAIGFDKLSKARKAYAKAIGYWSELGA